MRPTNSSRKKCSHAPFSNRLYKDSIISMEISTLRKSCSPVSSLLSHLESSYSFLFLIKSCFLYNYYYSTTIFCDQTKLCWQNFCNPSGGTQNPEIRNCCLGSGHPTFYCQFFAFWFVDNQWQRRSSSQRNQWPRPAAVPDSQTKK